MLLSEEQRENFISRLQLTTAKGGEYIIMPNAANPAFLVPIGSKDIFTKGLALIKPLSGKGELKKRILSLIPPKWLKRKLPHMSFENKNEVNRNTIILPWSQKICDKLTYISFDDEMKDIIVHKYAFTDTTRKMVRNEHAFLSKIDTSKALGIIVPAIKGFEEGDGYTYLMQNYLDGMHMKELSPNISSFFSSLNSNEILPLSDHPYIQNRFPLIRNVLNEIGETEILAELDSLYEMYSNEKFHVATMHSDFSSSNTVQTDENQFVIIDWEDACEDGVCIDAEYFKFRKTLQNNESWSIKNADQFLVVFHYFYFMTKKRNELMLRRFNLSGGAFNLA